METILIAGANRGIGLALTRRFLEAGKQVIATCRYPVVDVVNALSHVFQ